MLKIDANAFILGVTELLWRFLYIWFTRCSKDEGVSEVFCSIGRRLKVEERRVWIIHEHRKPKATRQAFKRWRRIKSSAKGHSVDALALRGDEGRSTLRKATGRCEQPLIRGYPNGATHRKCGILIWIHRVKRRTLGTETSKYQEERTSTETPKVVASEMGPGQWY